MGRCSNKSQPDSDAGYGGWEWLCFSYMFGSVGSVNVAVLHDMLQDCPGFFDLGGCLLELVLVAL